MSRQPTVLVLYTCYLFRGGYGPLGPSNSQTRYRFDVMDLQELGFTMASLIFSTIQKVQKHIGHMLGSVDIMGLSWERGSEIDPAVQNPDWTNSNRKGFWCGPLRTILVHHLWYQWYKMGFLIWAYAIIFMVPLIEADS